MDLLKMVTNTYLVTLLQLLRRRWDHHPCWFAKKELLKNSRYASIGISRSMVIPENMFISFQKRKPFRIYFDHCLLSSFFLLPNLSQPRDCVLESYTQDEILGSRRSCPRYISLPEHKPHYCKLLNFFYRKQKTYFATK